MCTSLSGHGGASAPAGWLALVWPGREEAGKPSRRPVGETRWAFAQNWGGGDNPCEWLNPPHLLLGRNWPGSQTAFVD